MKLQFISAELIHYVEFYYDRAELHQNDPLARVRSRSVKKLEIPNAAFAFQFYDMVEVVVRLGHKTFALRERLNESRTYHYGHAIGIDAALRQYPRSRHQLRQFKKRGGKRVLRTLFGQWYPLEKEDVVINPNQRSRKS